MAKGIKAAPQKRKKKRLSEHARLVEERARSIPPGVVHELFDTSTLPVPPPAPMRRASPGRLLSKPPPPPPRPSHAPDEGEEAELEDLEELEEVDGSEESQTDGFGSHTISPPAPPERPSGSLAGGGSQRSRLLPAVLGVVIVGGLALLTGRELGRSRSVAPPAATHPPSVAVAKAPPALPRAPLAPVADDLPLYPPGVTAAASAEPVSEPSNAPANAPTADTSTSAVARVSPDPVTATAALAEPLAPRALSSAGSAPPAAPPDTGGMRPFDGSVADAAIRAAFHRAEGCRTATDPKGLATVTLTYAPSGRVTTALVSGVFAGTSTGSCIAAALRSARIEPFTGALVTIKRSATLE